MNANIPRFLGTVVAVVVLLTTHAEASAPAYRYTVSGGTVYDNKTKLTWQQTVPSTTYNSADAKTYCSNVGASLGGTGWRLPTVKELQTIVDYSQSNPAIDSTAFPSTPINSFWSSTAGATGYTWLVGFNNGLTGIGGAAAMANVRCVR